MPLPTEIGGMRMPTWLCVPFMRRSVNLVSNSIKGDCFSYLFSSRKYTSPSFSLAAYSLHKSCTLKNWYFVFANQQGTLRPWTLAQTSQPLNVSLSEINVHVVNPELHSSLCLCMCRPCTMSDARALLSVTCWHTRECYSILGRACA